jgi:hypothetical protein
MPRLEDYSFGRLVIDGAEHTRDGELDERRTAAALHLTC